MRDLDPLFTEILSPVQDVKSNATPGMRLIRQWQTNVEGVVHDQF